MPDVMSPNKHFPTTCMRGSVLQAVPGVQTWSQCPRADTGADMGRGTDGTMDRRHRHMEPLIPSLAPVQYCTPRYMHVQHSGYTV